MLYAKSLKAFTIPSSYRAFYLSLTLSVFVAIIFGVAVVVADAVRCFVFLIVQTLSLIVVMSSLSLSFSLFPLHRSKYMWAIFVMAAFDITTHKVFSILGKPTCTYRYMNTYVFGLNFRVFGWIDVFAFERRKCVSSSSTGSGILIESSFLFVYMIFGKYGRNGELKY